MTKEKNTTIAASGFKDLEDIGYFQFEEEFMEKGVRCIPMIVRFKLDKAGIKLKLAEWNKFSTEERVQLARQSCKDDFDTVSYRKNLDFLVNKYTGQEATPLQLEKHPAWANVDRLPQVLTDKLTEFGWSIDQKDWKELTDLQRFALIKLCRPGHESRNFPKAVKEFGLEKNEEQTGQLHLNKKEDTV